MGAEAVMALMEADENSIPCVVSLDGNQVNYSPNFCQYCLNVWEFIILS